VIGIIVSQDDNNVLTTEMVMTTSGGYEEFRKDGLAINPSLGRLD
jgi:hypothetical protein